MALQEIPETARQGPVMETAVEDFWRAASGSSEGSETTSVQISLDSFIAASMNCQVGSLCYFVDCVDPRSPRSFISGSGKYGPCTGIVLEGVHHPGPHAACRCAMHCTCMRTSRDCWSIHTVVPRAKVLPRANQCGILPQSRLAASSPHYFCFVPVPQITKCNMVSSNQHRCRIRQLCQQTC